MPSAWTTAVLAGALALLLTVLLLIADPPPEAALPPETASQETTPPADSLDPTDESSATPPPNLELSIGRLDFQFDWDQQAAMLWTSAPVGEPVPPVAFRPPDNWRPASRRSSLVEEESNVDLEPFYLRAVLAESDATPLLPTVDDPSSPFGPGPARDLRIDVLALPARPGDANGLAVQTVLVRNRSDDPVEQVVVRQRVPAVENVIDVVPPAAITPDGQLLWELTELSPGEERSLLITTRLSEGDTEATVTQVDVQSQIGVSTTVSEASLPEPIETEPDVPLLAQPRRSPRPLPDSEDSESLPERVLPESFPGSPVSGLESRDDSVIPAALPDEIPTLALPEDPPNQSALPRPLPLDPARPPVPALSITANSTATARPGEVVTTIFEVANKGDAPAFDVVLTVHVAPELQHKHGDTVEHRIGRIAPGEQHRATLYTRARMEGTARLKAVLEHAGNVGGQHWEVVRVTAAEDASAPR
mgnify:FL=1